MDTVAFVSMLALLIAAVCVAIFGNILVAIFLGVIWAGMTNNYSNTN